jgi:phosphohistidine phosphatase
VRQAAQFAPEVQYRDTLYLAGAGELLEAIRQAPDTASLMLIGHNPGLHTLATRLAGHGDEPLLDELQMQFPTCALAVMTFDVKSWKHVAANQGTLMYFVYPKTL